MSGVRAGERLLQINIEDPKVAGGIAAKVGIAGEATIVVADERHAARARKACADAGALVTVHVAAFAQIPAADQAFDVIVVHGTRGVLASLDASARVRAVGEWHRVLRAGGRLVAMEPGTPSGLSAWFRRAAPEAPSEETPAALQSAGFKAVRVLADREGWKFVEGVKS